MAENAKEIERRLRGAGFSREIIKAAWPKWWSSEAELSPAALNDLKFSLSRKLGLSASSLFDEGHTVFVWKGMAKFKGLSTFSETEQSILTNFAASVAKLLLKCLAPENPVPFDRIAPAQIREGLLESGAPSMNLPYLFRFLLKVGIPIVYVRTFPLGAKKMTALAIRVGQRFAILLSKEQPYAAPVLFYIAHELGHIVRGHLSETSTLVDMDIENNVRRDNDELEANAFALELLTGRAVPILEMNRPARNATQLARAVQMAGEQYKIEPGILAMVYGHDTGQWPVVYGALKKLYDRRHEVWREINQETARNLQLEALNLDQLEFLSEVLQLPLDV